MRPIRASVVLLVCLCSLAAIPASEYSQRRQALRKNLGDSVLVLFGYTAQDAGELEAFRQEPNFYYLTGWREPSAILLLTAEQEALFLPKRNEVVERYTGKKVAPADPDAREATGFEQVFPVSAFETQLAKALELHQVILALKPGPAADRLQKLAPLRDVQDAARILARARAKKSDSEVALIQKATEVSIESHRAAWRRIAPGLDEYQVAATMTFPMYDAGCRPAYAPIVASGPNGSVLHYAKNTRRIQAGELVLMDVAAACSDYASDITRTVPAGGKFTPRQRELYLAVLGAQRAAIDAVKPGASMQTINKAARDYLEANGKLGRYLTHGISHGVGLEVHDPPDGRLGSTEVLAAGMVVTIEPGLYIPDEGIGIRIEDLLLVTDSGARILSAALPKEPDEIERAMARK